MTLRLPKKRIGPQTRQPATRQVTQPDSAGLCPAWASAAAAMAEEVDAERQAFMDELGMTYVELEKAAADQEKAPPAQDIGSASDASDGSPTPATSWGFFEANAECDKMSSVLHAVASCAA